MHLWSLFFAVATKAAWTAFVYFTGSKRGCKAARQELKADRARRALERDARRLYTDRQLSA